jgi:2-dehydro-3-deoxyphosphooctonate aldolase (KDO 8-P synthase)
MITTDSKNFFLIAGPCAIEGSDIAFAIAKELRTLCADLEIPLIFKGSYKKANRTSLTSFTGIGDQKAMDILEAIKADLGLQVTSDIHTADEAEWAAKVLDVIQIPAFLCRQTDLLVAAAKTGKMINIKKGQFMSPGSMRFAAQKILDSGNNKVCLTERGTSFGHYDLVVDFRGIAEMKGFGHPVIMDCTHSLQQPNQSSGVTGGKPQMIETIAKAAIATGADGLFIETHPDPSQAKSDGANMLPLEQLKPLLIKLKRIKEATLSD